MTTLKAGLAFLALWFGAGVGFAALWALTAPMRTQWDKETLPEGEQPLRLTGWRR